MVADSCSYSLVLGVLLGLGACAPSVSHARRLGADLAYTIDCSDLDRCIQRAQTLCPAGYDLKGAGSRESTHLAHSIIHGDHHHTHHERERTQLVVECRLVGGEPTPPAIPGIGGFTLGAPATTARATCHDAGFVWSRSGEAATCTASPDASLAAGEIHLAFSAGQVAAIAIRRTSGDDLIDDFGRARVAVEQRFGAPVNTELEPLRRCDADPRGCLGRPGTLAEGVWGGRDGERLVLTARVPQHGVPELVLVVVSRAVPGDPVALVPPQQPASSAVTDGAEESPPPADE